MGDRRLVYLDTGVLMRRAESNASSVRPRIAAMMPYLDSIFADAELELGCSELTIMEYHSNINANFRSSANPEWDFDWYRKAQDDLFALIAAGTITIVPVPPHCFERAMALITEATETHQRALRSWDAAHAITAAQWSYDRNAPVEIYSSDGDLEVPLLVSSFSGRLKVVNLDVLAGTGEGLDRRNR